MLNIPVLIMLFLILLIFSATLLPLAAPSNSSVLHLSPSLHLSLSSSFHKNEMFDYMFVPISLDLMFTVGIPTLDPYRGVFLPILSSPSFNYSTTSNVSSQSRGFSLGFYFSCPQYNYDGISYCNMYMAVCAGSSGNYTDDVPYLGVHTRNESEFFTFFATRDGFVVPVWIANLDRPIKYPESASLRVDSVDRGSSNSTLELRLMDGDDVAWKVSNITASAVGNNNIVLEILQDSGKLVIYDDSGLSSSSSSSNLSKPVYLWQSPNRTDVLLEGQMLEVGVGELTSNDSSYSARMEKGALVLYINTLHFYGLQPPVPYWIYPLYRPPNDIKQLMTANDSIRQLINSAPCSTSSAYAAIEYNEADSAVILSLLPGKTCSVEYIGRDDLGHIAADGINVSWSFLRLENDGSLHMYAVSNPTGARFSVAAQELISVTPNWGGCHVPMACGTAGMCTPETSCTCDYAAKSSTQCSKCSRRSGQFSAKSYGKYKIYLARQYQF